VPDGRLPAGEGTVFGIVLAAAGLFQLGAGVNLVSAAVAALTLASYVLLYTPLKRRTRLSTIVGAFPGALPPVIGWAAATGDVSPAALTLFAIVFLWQMPHFLAIAWLYREEYAKAGFVMLPVRDPEGVRTGRQAVSHTLGLMAVSVCPSVLTGPDGLPVAGTVYFFGALLLGLAFLWCAIQFSRELTQARARQLFFASILYLPLLFGLMALDKVRH